MHELSAGSDDIGIEFPVYRAFILFKSNLSSPLSFDIYTTISIIFGIFGCSESPRSLLVHFSAGCYAINGEINQLLGTDQADQFIGVFVDIIENLMLARRLRITVLGMGTRVNDAVHI